MNFSAAATASPIRHEKGSERRETQRKREGEKEPAIACGRSEPLKGTAMESGCSGSHFTARRTS